MNTKQVVVIAGPSGGGKNSIIDRIIERCDNCIRLVTATTRAPRPGEVDGIDYHFLPTDVFLKDLDNGDILEHRYVESLGTHYGVYKPGFESRLAAGKVVIAHLDIIGARFLKEHYNATTVFILPESFDVLAERVRGRNPSMSEDEIAARMAIARREIDEDSKEFDFKVVNRTGELDAAVDEVIGILEKEGYTLS